MILIIFRREQLFATFPKPLANRSCYSCHAPPGHCQLTFFKLHVPEKFLSGKAITLKYRLAFNFVGTTDRQQLNDFSCILFVNLPFA
jgi:hypothetical protein